MNNWITSLRYCVLVVIGICITLMLIGCAEIGFLGSKEQTFTGKDQLFLPVPRPDILDIIADVGKSMGYSVSALDKKANIISLSYQSSMFTAVMIGKLTQSTLTVSSKDNGKRLDIDIFLTGNFGTGGQEEATKIVNNFKEKLLEKIGQ